MGEASGREASGSGVLRLISGQRIVDELFASHPQTMSRAGIARATGLSKPTVSALIAEMEAAGLVRVANDSPKSGSIGRPAALYELVPTARHSVAADIGATKMLVGISDLFGNLVIEREIETGRDAPAALEGLIRTSAEMLRSIEGPCSGVCVGVPGIYRRDRDRVEAALNLPGFDGLALHAYLAQHLAGPIQIENDVNLAALGELAQMGPAQPPRDFAAISVGTGIGLGMVVGGDLYRGGTGSAGEVGSLLLSLPARGAAPVTLEDVASAPSIRKLFGKAIEEGYRSELDPSADVPEILQAVNSGDDAARVVLDQAASAMAVAVSHLCLIADPTRVVFGGGVGSNEVFVDAVRLQLCRLIDSPPELVASTLGRRAALVGAVSMSLRSVQESLVPEIFGGAPR